MTTTSRPTTARKHTRSTEKNRADGLDEGLSFVDIDGTRLNITFRDVKGRHDLALVAAIGLDFRGLLEALQKRQGLDLLAAVVWFGRLVHDREPGSYEDFVDDFGFEAVMEADIDEVKKDADPPEA